MRAVGPLRDAACDVFARNGYERTAADASDLSPAEVLLCHIPGLSVHDRGSDGAVWGRLQSSVDFAPTGLAPPFAWVNLVVVDEGSRRQGVGRALLAAFADEARSRGATFLGLEAFPLSRWQALHAFYRSCGFSEFGLCEGRYRLGQPL